MPAKKTPTQLQRDIDEALARRHGQARERWLSLQAGPRHREREVAYGEMAAASRAIEDARSTKRSHSTMKTDSDEETVNILSIDAWREPEGGWTWNQWYKVGKISRSELAKLKTNAQILKYMRDEGYLKDTSKGRVTVDDDQYNYVIVDNRRTDASSDVPGSSIAWMRRHALRLWSSNDHIRDKDVLLYANQPSHLQDPLMPKPANNRIPSDEKKLAVRLAARSDARADVRDRIRRKSVSAEPINGSW